MPCDQAPKDIHRETEAASNVMHDKSLSRTKLFEIVWSQPMIHAGAELGISGTGLKKICLKHEIPLPPQGWWAKLAAGHRLATPQLPPATDERLNQVRMRDRKSLGLSGALKSQTPRADVEVPSEKPTKLPVWVEKTEAALRARKPDNRGLLHLSRSSWPNVSIDPRSIDRLILFLVGFDEAIGTQGWTLEPSDEGLRVLVEGEPVGFKIEDRLTRRLHEPTPDELAEQARRRRFQYTYLSDQLWPKYDYTTSGEMAFVVTGTVNDGLRRKWGDTKRQRLEQALPSIIQSFCDHAAAQIAKRQYWADQKRRWAEVDALRRAKAEQDRLNNARMSLAGEIDSALAQVAMLDRVIHHIEEQPEGCTEVQGYLTWCRDRRDALCRKFDLQGLAERLQGDEFAVRDF